MVYVKRVTRVRLGRPRYTNGDIARRFALVDERVPAVLVGESVAAVLVAELADVAHTVSSTATIGGLLVLLAPTINPSLTFRV